MRPLTRRSGVWIEPPYRIWLTGAATLDISAEGRLAANFKGDATLTLIGDGALSDQPLTGNGTLTVGINGAPTQKPLAGVGILGLTGVAALTKKPLTGAGVLALVIGYSGTVFRGAIIEPPAVYRTLYRAYLTANGYSDLELPISSFQGRRRDGEPSYLAIVVPAPSPYLSAIADRTGGQIVVKAGFVNLITGEETLAELDRVDFDYFRYDLGARSSSATLSGHRTASAREPLTRALTGISYRATTDGQRTIRCHPDMYLAPGDTADVGNAETLVIASLSYTVSPTQAFMEVQDVEAV